MFIIPPPGGIKRGITYPQQIMSRRPLLRINLERKVQEIPKHSRQRRLILDRRRSVGGDEPQGAQRRLGEVRRLAFDHLDGHDAEGPDVDFATVLFARDDFGGHPVGGADHGGALVVGFVDLGAEAEVGWWGVSRGLLWG